MNYFHKKIWIAWRKLQFLMLPPDRRVRLEVSQDGRQWTFLLVSLYEAGYGVHVFGHSALFRELILLRKSAPIPFIVGGGERECGILMSDRKGDASHSPHILLDYDYFSGLTTKCTKRHEKETEVLTTIERQGGRENRRLGKAEEEQLKVAPQRGAASGTMQVKEQPQVGPKGEEVGTTESKSTANTDVGEDLGKNESRENFNHNRARGHVQERATEGWPVGRESGSERVKLHEYTRIEADEAERRLASQAGAEFSNPFTIELAQDSENTSPTRSANDPASSAGKPRADIGGLISDKSEVAKSLDSVRSAIDSDRRPNAGHSLKEWSGVFEGLSPSLLGSMPSKTPPARAPGVRALASSSVLIREIRGQNASTSAISYSPLVTPPEAVRMPYFMHPSVYHKGLHTKVKSESESERGRKRRFRIGFFGTHDPEFYSKHYHFPGPNRTEILNAFLSQFADQIKILEGSPASWPDANIVVAIDERGGDRVGKSFLSQVNYFQAMRECDFVLSPPGWCMPVAHNLIEAIFCGAIPITNAGPFMVPQLQDVENCLAFKDEEGLISVLEWALKMEDGKIRTIQSAVQEYYNKNLDASIFWGDLIHSNAEKIFVNAEENSIPRLTSSACN